MAKPTAGPRRGLGRGIPHSQGPCGPQLPARRKIPGPGCGAAPRQSILRKADCRALWGAAWWEKGSQHVHSNLFGVSVWHKKRKRTGFPTGFPNTEANGALLVSAWASPRSQRLHGPRDCCSLGFCSCSHCFFHSRCPLSPFLVAGTGLCCSDLSKTMLERQAS